MLLSSCFLVTRAFRRTVAFVLAVTFFAIFASSNLFAQNSQAVLNPPPFEAWLAQSSLPSNSGAAWVQEIGSAKDASKPIFAHNANAPLNPASVMKLYTTFAGLELLGAAYTWKTQVFAVGRDVVIKGGGDPRLRQQDVWRLLRELRLRGITKIEGDWVLDHTAYAPEAVSASAFDGEGMRPYNVAPDGLLMSFNATRILFTPALTDAAAWRVVADPLPAGWSVAGTVSAGNGSCGDWRRSLKLDIKPADIKPNNGNNAGGIITVGGSIPYACGAQEIYRSIAPAAGFGAGLVRSLWSELGGTHSGGFRDLVQSSVAINSALYYANAQLLASVESDPLSEVIRDINKRSNNVMARSLFLSLGQTNNQNSGQSGVLSNLTRAQGEAAMRAWLQSRGLDSPDLVFDNGSGLSRAERSTAAHIGRLLQAAYASPVMSELMSSLPIVGQDGTLKNRFKAMSGAAHLKTGTLNDVKAIAGYVLSNSGRRYVVVGMINHARAAEGQAALDKLVAWTQGQ